MISVNFYKLIPLPLARLRGLTLRGRVTMAFALVLVIVSARPELQADPTSVQSDARIRIVIPSLADVEGQVKSVIELSPDTHLQKQWKKLKNDMIDAFTDGVDATKPASLDIVFAADELSFDYRVPISGSLGDKNPFLEGLRGRSYKVRSLGGGKYELLEKTKKAARLQFDQHYAWISTGSLALPVTPRSAIDDLMPLLDLKKDIVAAITNDIDGVPLRRASFQAFRTQWEGRSRIRRSETPNAFELRKVLLKALLNEAERFFVEAQHVILTGKINTGTPPYFGRGDVSLTALPGTDLSKLIDEFGSKSSSFANVTTHETRLASSRLCVPLDAIRIGHIKSLIKSLRPILETEIQSRTAKQTDAQQVALIRAMNVVFDLMEDGTQVGKIDAIAELFASDSQKNIFVFGIRTANGKKADELVKLAPSLRSEWKVTLDADTHGGVSIHELAIGAPDIATFQSVFEGQRVISIGTSKNGIWIAAGADSLIHLKRAIDQAALPAPEKVDPVVASYRIELGKLVPVFEAVHKQLSSTTTRLTSDEKLTRKEVEKYLKLVHEATSGFDSAISGELRRVENRIEGDTELKEGALKSVGSILASTVDELE